MWTSNTKDSLSSVNIIMVVSVLCLFMGIISCSDDSTGSQKNDSVTVTSISPLSVTGGDTVTIIGSNFNESRPNIVIFKDDESGKEAVVKPIEVSSTQLKVIAPNSVKRATVTVRIGKTNMATSEQVVSIVPKPIISSVSPTYGLKGDEVTINGENFGTNAEDITVMFNNTEAMVQSVDSEQITVVVPDGLTTGEPLTVDVKVSNVDIESANTVSFSVQTEGQRLIVDHFDRDNTPKANKSTSPNPIGGAWKIFRGEWGIDGNAIVGKRAGSDGPKNVTVANTAVELPTTSAGSYTYTADYKSVNAGGWAGVAVNIQDAQHFYAIRVKANTGKVQVLARYVNPQSSEEGWHVVSQHAGKDALDKTKYYRFTVTSEEPFTFTWELATQDGAVVQQATESTKDGNSLFKYKGGYAGFYIDNTIRSFDNFKLEAMLGTQ